MNWGILALFHIQRWHTDYAPVPSLSHSVFTNGVQATRRNISLKTLPRLRQKVQIGRVHNLFAAIGHRSKRERASSSASPEIIPSMIVHCINNNTCTVGIYLIHRVSDKMLDLAAIKRDWTAKLLFPLLSMRRPRQHKFYPTARAPMRLYRCLKQIWRLNQPTKRYFQGCENSIKHFSRRDCSNSFSNLLFFTLQGSESSMAIVSFVISPKLL